MTKRTSLLGIAVLLGVQALVLYSFGQPTICSCGFVKFWEGVVASPGNSQHLTDWYTFSHMIHGVIFYFFLRWAFPQMSVWRRLFFAVGIEVAWEVIENTPMIINYYREQALAQGYVGDSILNSISDTLAMMLGFVLSWRWPTWLVVVLALALEVFVAYMIRDNLALNILNFIHIFPGVAAWQAGL